MQYDTDIRLVDAHAESVGGYHDADFSVLPAFLPEVFYGIVQSGMIEVGGNASCINNSVISLVRRLLRT